MRSVARVPAYAYLLEGESEDLYGDTRPFLNALGIEAELVDDKGYYLVVLPSGWHEETSQGRRVILDQQGVAQAAYTFDPPDRTLPFFWLIRRQ